MQGGSAIGALRRPYWLKQWAADSSQRSPTTVAPQKCLGPSFKLACQGTSPDMALIPPTIRMGLSIAGLAPHSARGEERGGRGVVIYSGFTHFGPRVTYIQNNWDVTTWAGCGRALVSGTPGITTYTKNQEIQG